MAKHVGAMYAHITSWSLRETFGEQGSGTQPDAISADQRWAQFLRMATPARIPSLRYHGMVSCWATFGDGNRMAFVNLYASEDGMNEFAAELASDSEFAGFVARYMESHGGARGPVTDVFHLHPASSALRALDAGRRREPLAGPPYLSITHWRIHPELGQYLNETGDQTGGEATGDMFTMVIEQVSPLILPHLRRNGVLTEWAVNTGDDTITFVAVYATNAGLDNAWAEAQKPGRLSDFVSRYFELVERASGPLIDIFQIGAEGQGLGDSDPGEPIPFRQSPLNR